MMLDKIRLKILKSIEVKNAMLEICMNDIQDAANAMIESVSSGGKILWCGNGGSAADAQHLATELMGGMENHERKPIPSISLVTDTSFLTAWSNDTGFESIFSRQIQGLGNKGDILIGISTSGNSENIIAGIKQAKYRELVTIVFTGKSGGMLDGLADISINIPSENTQHIQEAHIMVGQILCGLIEEHFLK